VTPAALELSSVVKHYGGLRPLRIEHLALSPGDHVALVGLDRAGAEVLVDLVTGAALPDGGDVLVLGRSTAAIRDSTEWLCLVDRLGIVSNRIVFLEALSVVQNLALPYSLEIEPPGEDLRARAVALAHDVGLDATLWDRRVGDLDPASRARVRLARAVALDPVLVLLEHPTAGVSGDPALALGRQVRETAERRGAATLTATADQQVAEAVAERVLALDPATGRLSRVPRSRGRPWRR
jgi:ABC-type lipoprotein export system ATPase subunit